MRHSAITLLYGLMGALLWLVLPIAAAHAGAGPRLALVIGNSNYQSVYSLKNAVSDSQKVAATLQSLGFEVTLLNDAGLEEMKAAVEDVATRAEAGAEAALFYFSGHGFQLGGANFIVPVDAVLDDRDKIAERTLRLDDIISRLDSTTRQTIILLDACRDNPLPANLRGQDTQGLAIVTTGVNTYTVFATAPGGVTSDGAGDAGPFAEALVENILLPDVPIASVMRNVRNAVLSATHEVQDPWNNDSLRSEFYFNRGDFDAGIAVADTDEGDFEAGVSFGDPVAPTDVAVAAPEFVEPEPAVVETAAVPAEPELVQPEEPVVDTAAVPAEPATIVVSDVPVEDVTLRGVGQPTTTPALVTPEPEVSAAPVGPVMAPLGEPTQTAALSMPVVTPRESVDAVILGTDISPEDELAVTPEPEAVPTIDVASAVQEHLKRVGCYVGTVDGDWGKGSRAALRRYFEGKQERAMGTEPTAELLAKLSDESAEVCKPEPVVVAKPKPTQQPTTANPTTPKKPKVASTPATTPATPTKPKLKLGGGTGTFR